MARQREDRPTGYGPPRLSLEAIAIAFVFFLLVIAHELLGALTRIDFRRIDAAFRIDS